MDSRFSVNPLCLASSFHSTGSYSSFCKINLVRSLYLVYSFVLLLLVFPFIFLFGSFFVLFIWFSWLGWFAIAITWLIAIHNGRNMSNKMAESVIFRTYSGENSIHYRPGHRLQEM